MFTSESPSKFRGIVSKLNLPETAGTINAFEICGEICAVRKHWRSVRDDETRKAKGKFEEHRRQAKRGNRLKRVSIRTYLNLDQTFNRME